MYTGKVIVGSTRHQGDAVVGKYHGKHSQHGRQHRAPHGRHGDGQKLFPFGKTQHTGRFVDGVVLVLEGVMEHKERNRERIEHRSHNDTRVSIETDVDPQKVGNEAVVAKEENQTHTVGDTGDEHGDGKQDHKDRFKPDIGSVEKPCQEKGQRNGNDRCRQSGNQGVLKHGPELLGGKDTLNMFAADVAK